MSFLFLLFASLAQAHTLSCVGPGLSYSTFRPDGGPSIAPTEQLLLDGRLLIQVNPIENLDVRKAEFERLGPIKVIGKPVRHDRYYVTSHFEQAAQVTENGSNDFTGRVVCREETYDGPPIP